MEAMADRVFGLFRFLSLVSMRAWFFMREEAWSKMPTFDECRSVRATLV